MTAEQVAVIAAVILIPVGVLLIGIGTRPGPVPAGSPVEPADSGDGSLEEGAALSEPVGQPEEFTDPDLALTTLQTRPFEPLTQLGHESTGEERRIGRERLGSQLDADLAEVVRLIENRPPELRGLLLTPSIAVVAQELAMLRAYLRGTLTGLDSRLRDGSLQEGDQALAACLVSGLGRLPAHHGALFHRAPRADLALDAFFPGALLVEPAFTRAERRSFPAGGTGTGPLISYVIWSESGRRAPLLVGHSDTVLFASSARFRVLALDHRPGPGEEEITVYLAEETELPSGRRHRDQQMLEHLRQQAAQAGIGPIDGPAPSPVEHPGLDESGYPFVPVPGRLSQPETVS